MSNDAGNQKPTNTELVFDEMGVFKDQFYRLKDIIDQLRAELCDERAMQSFGYKESKAEIESLRAELERERMRLVACGVAALSNTVETAAKIDECHDDYKSASLSDVQNAIQREMKLRAENAELKYVIECSKDKDLVFAANEANFEKLKDACTEVESLRAELAAVASENQSYKKHASLFEESLRLPFKQREDIMKSQISGAIVEVDKLSAENAELGQKVFELTPLYSRRQALEKLSAANAEIAKWKDEYFNVSKFATDYENKLTAATAQMDAMAEALQGYSGFGFEGTYYADEALAQYQQFKKNVSSE